MRMMRMRMRMRRSSSSSSKWRTGRTTNRYVLPTSFVVLQRLFIFPLSCLPLRTKSSSCIRGSISISSSSSSILS